MIVHIRCRYCQGKDLKLVQAKYTNNGSPALELVDPRNDEPWFVATVNLPDQPPAPGCVWLKSWSENEGLPEALERAGVVRLTGRQVKVGDFDAYAQEAELITDEQGTKQ